MDKKRNVSGYFKSIISELMIEDRMRFKKIFWMSVGDFEFVSKHTDDIIFSKK